MSSSSGGSESTASMKEGAIPADTTPNMDPSATPTSVEHQSNHQHQIEPSEEGHSVQSKDEPKETEEDAAVIIPEIKHQIHHSPENRMASVITINGSEAGRDHEVSYLDMNSGKGSGRSERSGFDNPSYVDDEVQVKVSGSGGKVVNGGGRLSPPSSPPPRPPSPAGPFLNSVVATTPTPPAGANGRGPVMESPNSNIHNTSGLIMSPNEKEKSEIDGCTNVTEAVNLELVNMNPYGGAGLGMGDDVAGGKSGTNGGLNGIPVKRGAGDEETGDGGFGDPYDEYFVPVNEHRKYIRGEKLYVTKDRRKNQSWRRCICWGVAFTLLAIAILIAVLAGTGVILSQEKEVTSVESRSFGDHIPHVAESRDPNAPVETYINPTTLPPEYSSSFTPPPSMSSVPITPPSTEMSGLNVPRALEFDFKIDSMGYSKELEDSNSSQYKEIARLLEDELRLTFSEDPAFKNSGAEMFVKVVGFSPGSVVAKFRIGWRFKDAHGSNVDPIDSESLKDRLEAYILNHGGYLYTYHVASGTVSSNRVMDACQIDNGGCSHECRYDYEEGKFMCNCPPGLFLDKSGKKCTIDLMDETTTTTKGPVFDESPWMPMQPEEPHLVSEVVKHSESGHDVSQPHSEEDMHKEMDDYDKMHEHSNSQPMHPMETETDEEKHEDYDTNMHPVEVDHDTTSDGHSDEEHELHASVDDGKHNEYDMHDMNEHHHVEEQEDPSVGTGRSSGDHVAMVVHTSEESNEEHESVNDTEHDSHDEDKHSEDEKSVDSEEMHPITGEEMHHLGHGVESSENTSEEAPDSIESTHSDEEMNKHHQEGNHDVSEGGEVKDNSDEYHTSLHSFSNELHSPVSESEITTPESTYVNGLESHEVSSEAAEHPSSTVEPDAHETLNNTTREGDIWSSKGEIVSAVEHVIVKDENDTRESIDEEHDDMEHHWENDKTGGNASEASHDGEEVVAHVAMEGDEIVEKEGHPGGEMMVHDHEAEMPEHNEGRMSMDGEKQMVEHKDGEMMEPHEMETTEPNKIDVDQDHGEEKMEQGDEIVHGIMMVTPGEEGHKDDEMTSTKDEEMEKSPDNEEHMNVEHEVVDAMKVDSQESPDNVMSEEHDEHEGGNVPVIAVMHEENDIHNHEVNSKPIDEHKESDLEMSEVNKKHEEKINEDVVIHSTETVYGTDRHEIDLTAMSHEKPAMEKDNNAPIEQVDPSTEMPEMITEHSVSEEDKIVTDLESNTAAVENEADVVDEKHSDKEGGLWGISHEHKETTESVVTPGNEEKGHDESVSPVASEEDKMKNDEVSTIMPENEMKEMEEKVMSEGHDEHSMDKSSSEEESANTEASVTEKIPSHDESNVLIDNGDEIHKEADDAEHKVDVTSVSTEEEMKKPDEYNGMSTSMPETDVGEYDDPNIVPVEETPKGTSTEITDSRKLSESGGNDLKVIGLDEGKDREAGERNDTEVQIIKEDNEYTSVPPEASEASSIAENASKMPMTDEMEAGMMSSSTTSPAENSIEAVSENLNATDESIMHPASEKDITEHMATPVEVTNEPSTLTTPSPKENNIDDPPLHMQAGIPMVPSEDPDMSTTSITSEPSIVNDLTAMEEKLKKEGDVETDEKIAELESIEKAIDEVGEKLKEEAGKMEEHHSSTTTDDGTTEKNVEKDMFMMKDKEMEGKMSTENEEKNIGMKIDGVEKEEPKADTKEEVPSITTINQDFTEEHANTVHAMNPTSPSSIIEETSKDDGESSVSKDLEDIGMSEEKYSQPPEPHLPFETDDNERSNNLATLDNEDSLTVPESGNEAVVKVGAVDVGLKSTTEHTNEIVVVPDYRENWPSTALESNNITKIRKESDVMSDGHQTESSVLKEKDEETKLNSFEIPMKKKGEFKKPKHHEDEITKPLFGKEGKENLNKVDKIGLLPIGSTFKEEDSEEEINSEELDNLPVANTDIPSFTQQNMEIGTSTSTESGITSSTVSGDKGGEKLNAIGDDELGIKKDLGKPAAKESVKDNQEGVTTKLESSDKEGKSMTNEMSEPEATTQMMSDHKAESENMMDEHKYEMEMKEENVTKKSMTDEETTTVATEDMNKVSEKDGKGEPSKEIDVNMATTMLSEEEDDKITKMSEETAIPTTEATPEKVEELLKEMGGYGEGGHKVVSKSGVELPLGQKDMHSEEITTTADMPDSFSSPSSVMMSSTTVPTLTSLTPEGSEKQLTTTLPPEVETLKTEVNNEVEEKSLDKEIAHDEMDASKTENATSKDAIPTMLIHEIVHSVVQSSTTPSVEYSTSVSSSVESSSISSSVETSVSSASPVESVSKESEETTVMTDTTEVTTINTEPEVPMTTSSSDSISSTTSTHVSEILMNEETSSFFKKDDEGDALNTTESLLKSNETTDIVNRIDEVEESHGISNATTSALPETDLQYFSKCTSGQFECKNGTSLTPYSVTPISSSLVSSPATGLSCVPLSAKCDSINDCSDGSDEVGCIDEGCPGNFQCTNGQCLKRHLVCNGIVDCNDYSDETNCEKWQCQFDEFQCPSGRCIPVLWLCDGKADCDNHTDEYNCQNSCGNNEYLCPEGWCIPMSWRCNGVPECADGEDEKLCDCSLEQVKCGTGGCVARSEICDGEDQCPDKSDEWGCIRLHNETMKLEVRTSENIWLPVCADNWGNEWSNLVCQNFGYSQAVFTEYPSAGDFDGSSDVFMLKSGANISANHMRLPGVLERAPSSSCSSGIIVEISCQEYTCGNHGLADGIAARLVGGDEATNGQWPSVALLYHARQRATCTASIISPRWLIASYNCLHMSEKSLLADSWVAFGGGSTFDKDKPETQIKSVRSIVPYPQVKYNRFLYNHDVALVELTEPFSFTRSVGAICLPEKAIEPRQLCVTAGWGYTSPGEINFSQYLHYLPVPTIDLNDCNSTRHYGGFITEDKICAGFTDATHSPCYNDEGAPLMCVSEGGIWELQGVLSYHSNCGRGYHPSIFSSVTAVRDWVKQVVGGRFERRSTFNVRRRRRTKRRRSTSSKMTNIIWT